MDTLRKAYEIAWAAPLERAEVLAVSEEIDRSWAFLCRKAGLDRPGVPPERFLPSGPEVFHDSADCEKETK